MSEVAAAADGGGRDRRRTCTGATSWCGSRRPRAGRAIARYLQGFEEIRKIQDFILERAEAEGTLVVDNVNIDDTVGMVVDALYDVIEQSEEGDGAGE